MLRGLSFGEYDTRCTQKYWLFHSYYEEVFTIILTIQWFPTSPLMVLLLTQWPIANMTMWIGTRVWVDGQIDILNIEYFEFGLSLSLVVGVGGLLRWINMEFVSTRMNDNRKKRFLNSLFICGLNKRRMNKQIRFHEIQNLFLIKLVINIMKIIIH